MTTPTAAPLVVRKSLVLPAPPQRVFELFTRELDRWWPRSHHIGADAGFQARMDEVEGGRWYERGDSGREADWGRVLAWQPPALLRLSWQVSADWQPDARIATVVELRFLPEGEGQTRLELEHLGFEHYGDQAAMMQAMFDSPGGWSGILAALPEALGA